MNQEVMLAPPDEDFETKGAEWRITVPRAATAGLNELLLRIRYTGDVARLYLGSHLLEDNFYDGQVWEVGLKRFATEADAMGLALKVLPLGEGAPIYLPEDAWPKLLPGGQRATVQEINPFPVYEVTIDAGRSGN